MIALAKDADESKERIPLPVVIAFPSAVGTDAGNAVNVDIAQAQQELAMLNHAMAKCDLIQKHSKEKHPKDRK